MSSHTEEFINLFGIDNTTRLADLKFAYHSIALLTHPDRGGNTTDMQKVAFLYAQAKRFLEHRDRCKTILESTDLSELHALDRRALDATCAECPSYAEIYEETRGAIDERFHASFVDASSSSSSSSSSLLDGIGYGEFMTPSEYAGTCTDSVLRFQPYYIDTHRDTCDNACDDDACDDACDDKDNVDTDTESNANLHHQLVILDHSSSSADIDRMAHANGTNSVPGSTYEYSNYSHAHKRPVRPSSEGFRLPVFETYSKAYEDALLSAAGQQKN